MPKSRVLVLVLLLASSVTLSTIPTAASELDGQVVQLEELAREIERAYARFDGFELGRPVIRKIDDDSYVMTMALDASGASATALSGFRALAVGQQTSTPTNPRYLVNPVLVSVNTVLNFWWAVHNDTAEDIVASTRLVVKGAGRTFLAQTEDRTYSAGSITIHWEGVNQPLERPGTYTVKARISGAGGRKTSFIAE